MRLSLSDHAFAGEDGVLPRRARESPEHHHAVCGPSSGKAPPAPNDSLHDEQQQQLPRADLRAFDHERAALLQGRIRFEQHLPILK